MSLTADPQACTVPAAGGASTHKLVNAGAEKLVFKIKSSNNKEYRVSPVFGFIDPSGSKDLTITRNAGAPKEDKLVIHFGPAPADATDAQAAFGAVTPAGTVTIPVSATEEVKDLELEFGKFELETEDEESTSSEEKKLFSTAVDNKLREDLKRMKKIRLCRGLRNYWKLRFRLNTKTTSIQEEVWIHVAVPVSIETHFSSFPSFVLHISNIKAVNMVNKKIKTKYADIAPNKSGVPSRNISLTADPQACTVPAAGGASTHKLVNAGAEKLVFKIKSSNNKEYRISPVFGFIDPSGSKDLTITRTAGAPKGDKLVIYFGPAPADATDAQAAFGAITPAGTVTIPLSATEEVMTDLETEEDEESSSEEEKCESLEDERDQLRLELFFGRMAVAEVSDDFLTDESVGEESEEEYRVSPVFGFIDPSESKDLTITRNAGAPKEDKLVIYFGLAPADATDAQAAFGAITPAGTVIIPLSATEDLETEDEESTSSEEMKNAKKRKKSNFHKKKFDATRKMRIKYCTPTSTVF
ncbi:unnamed protein product [Caenorhabditis brenneri]